LAAPPSTTRAYTTAGGTTPGMGSGMTTGGAAATGVKLSAVAPALSGSPLPLAAAPAAGGAAGSAAARTRGAGPRAGRAGRARVACRRAALAREGWAVSFMARSGRRKG
jgi:hypothetical protein